MTTGYARQQTAALEQASPEQTLAWGLTTTARKMAEARDSGAPEATLLDAVRLNWRLWTIIQAEQADPDCQTPKQIRESLLSLSNFVDKHTIGIIAHPDAAKVDTLININRQIAAGLLGTDLTPEQRAERDRERAKLDLMTA
jgi:flagellar biosynthesis activator protein FlaF